MLVTYLFLQTKNNTPDLAIFKPEFMRMFWVFNIICTVLNVIILKSLTLALVNEGYRKTISSEVESWNLSPEVAITLHRATIMRKRTDIGAIESVAFNS